jgi:hypothetical protein
MGSRRSGSGASDYLDRRRYVCFLAQTCHNRERFSAVAGPVKHQAHPGRSWTRPN